MRIDPDLGAAFPGPRRRARQPWTPMVAAVLNLAGEGTELVHHAERPWASITFSGSRHTLLLGFEGEKAVLAGEAFLDALPDHEFAVPAHIVADAAVIAVTHTLVPAPSMTVEIELLLLEDR